MDHRAPHEPLRDREAHAPYEPRIERRRDAVLAPAPRSPASLVIDDPRGIDPSPVLASVARSAVSVLIHGETGAGKQLVAETLHRLSGRAGALIAINCAAIGSELLESELFGHERGAFTGAVTAKPGLLEVAGAGTMLLDEIGDMPLALQAKLLRAVEGREVRRVGGTRTVAIEARFVAATHRDLLAAVATGTFRLDLYYRLAGVTLSIPPLRERRGRIAAMASELLAAAAARDGRPTPTLSAGALARLAGHGWPGNVRELRNVLDRALIFTRDGEPIEAAHVVFDAAPSRAAAGDPAHIAGDPAHIAGDPERGRLVDALARSNGNQTRAAHLLGMSRSAFATRLAIYKIPRPRA